MDFVVTARAVLEFADTYQPSPSQAASTMANFELLVQDLRLDQLGFQRQPVALETKQDVVDTVRGILDTHNSTNGKGLAAGEHHLSSYWDRNGLTIWYGSVTLSQGGQALTIGEAGKQGRVCVMLELEEDTGETPVEG